MLIVIQGSTGSGKSWAAMKIGEKNDKTFTIDSVSFSPSGFIHMINSGNLKAGSILIIDEAGVSMSSRNFWTEANKQILNVLQTFRCLNLCVVFTVPSISYIDKGVRGLFHYMIKMKSIDYDNQTSKGRIYRIKTDQFGSGKVFYIFPKLNMGNLAYTIKEIKFCKPSEKLIADYDVKKKKFALDVNLKAEGVLAKIDKENEKAVPPKILADKVFSLGVKNFLTMFKYKGFKRADTSSIELEFNIGGRKALRVKKLVDRRLDAMRAKGKEI